MKNLAIVFEDTNKCDADLYGTEECHRGIVNYAIFDLDQSECIAHLCSDHVWTVFRWMVDPEFWKERK